jgi:hypothetical protein
MQVATSASAETSPLSKIAAISRFFKATTVTLHVSREKTGNCAAASRVRIYARRDNARKTVTHSQHITAIIVANIVSIAANEIAYIMA